MHVATLIAYLAGAILFVVMIKADMRIVKHDMRLLSNRQEMLSEAFKQQGEILKQIAVQDNRLDRVESDIKEIRHGEGFVFPIMRSKPTSKE